MAYSRLNLQNGQVLTADHIKHIEDGIVEAESTSSSGDGGTSHTPVRGEDYWTENDIAEIKSYVDEAILGGAW